MRLVFFGTAAFAVPSLEALVVKRHDVLRCVTQPERPQGRGLQARPSPVKVTAQRLGLPVEEPDDLLAWLANAQGLALDVGIVIAYGRLIPPEWLKRPRHGMFGVHPSLLPKYRGASPIPRAILNNERTSGVTVFRLDERLDAGDVALQRSIPLGPRDTTEAISGRLASLGAGLLVEALEQLDRGRLAFHPQDHLQATYAPKLIKTDGLIDWQAAAASIDRLVRAATPWPGAFTVWAGQLLKVWSTSYDPHDHAHAGSPGAILFASPDGVAVATASGTLVIHELQLPGRRRMAVRDFLAGHQMQVGQILGEGQGIRNVGPKT